MTTSFSTTGLQEVFAFPFRQEKAGSKLAIAAVVLFSGMIIPILPCIVFQGYLYQVMAEVIHNGRLHLPGWTDWGTLLKDGLKFAGASFIYTLPVNVLMSGSFFLYFTSMIFFSILMEEASASPFILLLFTTAPFLFLAAIALGYLLLMLTGIVLPIGLGNMVARGRFGAAFNLASMWRVLRANLAGYLVAYVLVLGLTFLVMFLFQILYMTVVLCFLIPLLMMFLVPYASIVSVALFAQVYREGAVEPVPAAA